MALKTDTEIICLLLPEIFFMLAASASQAYIERFFSACGMLSHGRRNRMSTSLEMSVRLKLNAKVLA